MSRLLNRYYNKQDKSILYLSEHTVDELKEIAKDKGIDGYSKMKKDELIEAIKAGD